ncbi:MAG: tRNA threonylcarbamoyladenosine dehydratase [Sediminibacterium sp.]|jgi:tRNA A37 threonylcarbamoyladenosine dehydratase|nr:tRNA threonylcarbamoyladenosine dehydratase [Sediminibacterium sp.]
MIPAWMSRSELLLGKPILEELMKKHVLVVGLGGVGGICAEMIVRAGVGKITIVDADTVDISNTNRQIAALHSTVGKVKAEVLAERLKDINPDLVLEVIPQYLKDELVDEVVGRHTYDYAVDCIDTLGPKVAFLKACLDHGIPVVSSLGAGGRVDPSKVKVADISKTFGCNLARYVRKRLKNQGVKTGFQAVFSTEKIDDSKVIVTEKAFPKKSLIGTISYMPAIFGCTVASVVVRGLYQTKEEMK